MSTPFNRTIKKIVVHHLGDGKPYAMPLKGRWNPHGYQYPEYDFGIDEVGREVAGRHLNVLGAHCIADKKFDFANEDNWWNKHAIGVVCCGDFTKYAMPTFMEVGLTQLLTKLCRQHGLTEKDIYAHREVSKTACPGFDIGPIRVAVGERLRQVRDPQPVKVVVTGAEVGCAARLEDGRVVGQLAPVLKALGLSFEWGNGVLRIGEGVGR